MSRKALLACCSVGAAALVLATAYLWEASVVVLGRDGQVESAVITDSSGRAQKLYRLPGRVFHTIPRMEGVIEVRCLDGSRGQMGYVTSHLGERIQVGPGPGPGCSHIAYV